MAARLGVTVQQLRAEMVAFAQSEGYDTHGRKYPTLDAWVRRNHTDPKPDRTPWHKSDDYNN